MAAIFIPIVEAVGASIVATLIILHALNHGGDDEEEDDESENSPDNI